MRVAVKIDRLFAHLVPRSERVVTQDQELTLHDKLGVVLDARPARGLRRRDRIVASDNQMLPPVQHRQQLVAVAAAVEHEVTQMPDIVVIANGGVPILDQCHLVRGHIGERPAVDPQNAGIGKMRVTGEENHRCRRPLAAWAAHQCKPVALSLLRSNDGSGNFQEKEEWWNDGA